jgi:hypothetical protein
MAVGAGLAMHAGGTFSFNSLMLQEDRVRAG